MKWLTLIPFLFVTHILFAQLQTEIKTKLVTGDFQLFKKYVDTLSNKQSGVGAHWSIDREITTGFKEKILLIKKSVANKEDSNIHTVYTYKVNLLCTENTIILYDLMERKSKKMDNKWVSYYSSIDIFRNDSLLEKMNKGFFNSFGGKLKMHELFIDSIVYGTRCSNSGTDPVEKIHLDLFVKTSDKTALTEWLQSTNVETQLYAVEGYYALKKRGYKINENEYAIIKNIIKRKGIVRTCSGCYYQLKEIEQLTRHFKF